MKKKNIIELTHCSVDEYKELKKLPVALMADNVRSMQNIGAMMRTCDAFLIHHIVLAGISGCPPHPEISKTAIGAEESVEWRYAEDSVEEVKRMKEEGWRIMVLEQTHGSVPLQNLEVKEGEKYLLVAGNEVEGVKQKIVDMADVCLEIPQYGTKHSLKVAITFQMPSRSLGRLPVDEIRLFFQNYFYFVLCIRQECVNFVSQTKQ